MPQQAPEGRGADAKADTSQRGADSGVQFARIGARPGNDVGASSSMKKHRAEDDEDEDEDMDDDDEGAFDSKKKRKKVGGGVGASSDPLKLTEKQKIEKRERNREHAKRSRIRKKVLLDLLSDQLNCLRAENVKLRRVITERLPHLAAQIFAKCTTEESLLLRSTEDAEGGEASGRRTLRLPPGRGEYEEDIEVQHSKNPRLLMEPDFRLIQALINSQQNFVLSVKLTLPYNLAYERQN